MLAKYWVTTQAVELSRKPSYRLRSSASLDVQGESGKRRHVGLELRGLRAVAGSESGHRPAEQHRVRLRGVEAARGLVGVHPRGLLRLAHDEQVRGRGGGPRLAAPGGPRPARAGRSLVVASTTGAAGPVEKRAAAQHADAHGSRPPLAGLRSERRSAGIAVGHEADRLSPPSGGVGRAVVGSTQTGVRQRGVLAPRGAASSRRGQRPRTGPEHVPPEDPGADPGEVLLGHPRCRRRVSPSSWPCMRPPATRGRRRAIDRARAPRDPDRVRRRVAGASAVADEGDAERARRPRRGADPRSARREHARCGRGASRGCPRPSRPGATTSARCGRRARGAA